jgi:ABC-type sugar transport system substrate-binding protein
MKRHLLFALIFFVAAALMLIWGFVPGIWGTSAYEAPVIGLVLNTDIGLHAATIKQGARLAARELKLELIFAAPALTEDASAAQSAIIKRMIGQNVSALLIVPASGEAAQEALAAARGADIPLTFLDAGEGLGARYVGTDHSESGSLAIAALGKRVDGDMRLIILTAPSDGVCAERLKGALDALPNNAPAAIIECDDAVAAEEAVRGALVEDKTINAILTMNGTLSEGAARALASLYRLSGVRLVGFDCDQTRISYLQSGAIDATFLRSPLNIGYLGVFNALSDSPDIFTPGYIVDSSQILDPAYVKLVFPLVR